MTNCPNCGAPITRPTCEYCGTKFVDFNKRDAHISKILHESEMKAENDLLEAKTKALANAEAIKVLYEEALKAMRRYVYE